VHAARCGSSFGPFRIIQNSNWWGHDPRGLLVNPHDRQDYAQVRTAWLDQVSRTSGMHRFWRTQRASCGLPTARRPRTGLKQAIKLIRKAGCSCPTWRRLRDAISGISGHETRGKAHVGKTLWKRVGFREASGGRSGQGIRYLRTHGLGPHQFQKLCARRRSKLPITIR